MNSKNHFIFNDQSGVALVIAMLMLLILTLIGTASITTSTYEIRLSGNKRGSTVAFYATDGGIQSALAAIDNFNLSARFVPVDLKTLPDDLQNQSIDSKFSSPSLPLPPGVRFVDPPKITIFHARQTNVPRASGFSAINFEYDHFIIDSVGSDQMDLGLVKSNAHLREKIVNVRPTAQGVIEFVELLSLLGYLG
jgi:hypothetical protein